MLYYVHSSLIYNTQKLETTQCHLTEWIQKIWYIYTRDYYTVIKNNDFMKFTAHWMELDNIILSEVTEPQRNTYDMYSLMSE